jgi:RNA polymerase sigma factor (sigma-70 family)
MEERGNELTAACDAELLRRMAEGGHGSKRGLGAWAEFYNRHKAYLYAVLTRAHGKDIGEARVTEIVQDAFVRAYQRAQTYRPDGSAQNDDAGRKQARAWLGRIADNILRDSFRREPQVVFMDESELEAKHDQTVQEESDSPPPSAGALKFERALAQLTTREQEVLRVTGFWYERGQRQQRLPNSVMAKLTADLNTTPENIRQIRARATKKLRKIMESE